MSVVFLTRCELQHIDEPLLQSLWADKLTMIHKS